MRLLSYVKLVRECKNVEFIVDTREEIVKMSMEIGINKCAKMYNTSRNTIKRWKKRYLELGRLGLYDRSKRPKNSPRKASVEVIEKVQSLAVSKKEKKKQITSTKIYRELNLENDVSYVTVNKYVKEAVGKKKKRKETKTNGGNISWKKDLKPFDRVQVDVKYLTDIEGLKPYFKGKGLAKYEFSFRGISSGFAFVAYAYEKSVTNSKIFFEKVVHDFFKSIPKISLKDIVVQTDNGGENTNRKRKGPYTGENKKSIVTLFIEENYKEHKTIIPGHCTAQSDVESFHNVIERECLAWDDIVDNDSLLYYTNKFLEEFNNKKRWKCDYTPIEKLEEYFGCNIEIPKAIILD